MTGYAFHPEARTDLDEIWDYIAEQNPDDADRVIADILAAVRALVPVPYQGHRRTDLTSRPLRFSLVRDYLIAYAPEEKPLWDCCYSCAAQPASHGRDSQGQRITLYLRQFLSPGDSASSPEVLARGALASGGTHPDNAGGTPQVVAVALEIFAGWTSFSALVDELTSHASSSARWQ